MAGTYKFTVEHLESDDPRREEALRLLLAAPGDSRPDLDRRVHRLKEYIQRQGLILDPLVGAAQAGQLMCAAALIESPGGLGAVFIPTDTAPGMATDATVALLRNLQERAWRRPLVMVQALPDAEETTRPGLFAEAGFEFLAELIYLERSARDPQPSVAASDAVTFVAVDSQSEGRLSEVLELTYQHSKDCPKLTGIRRTDEIIATHRATGIYDPAGWLLAMIDGEAAGALLMAGVQERNALEVVYMGVVPAYRQRAVGHAMLAKAVELCRQKDDADLTLAVDRANAPARALYRRWSFQETARRQAWIAVHPERR
jgi:GNAT superfamily N-acetyltransferase